MEVLEKLNFNERVQLITYIVMFIFAGGATLFLSLITFGYEIPLIELVVFTMAMFVMLGLGVLHAKVAYDD